MNIHLTNALRNNQAWCSTSPQLITQIINRTGRHTHWYSCRSKTLNHALNNTLGAYSGNSTIPNSYTILKGMYELLLKNKTIQVSTDYLTPSAEQCTDLDTFLDTLPNYAQTPDKIKIRIYAVPRGKSFLKPILDTTPLQRFKNIETCCILNVSHFIRIYKNFPRTNPEDITIFTSDASPDLIAMLWILLPVLLDIKTEIYPEDAPEELKKTLLKHNERVAVLTKFCEELYTIKEHTTQALHVLVTQATSEFTDLFDFQAQALNTFATNLANTTTQNAIKHYNTLLQNTVSKIDDLEQQLRNQYENKTNYERQIIANKLITPEDVQPLFDTIKNSKHIEVLSSSNTTLTLRITAPLQYFADEFERYEKNLSSDYNYHYRNLPHLKNILHKIFVTREYKIVVQAIITLTLTTNYGTQPIIFDALRGNVTQFTRLPNPHLWHYNCWGQAKTEMLKNISEGNYELVIMQAVAAVQSVNVAEHASFVSHFLVDFRQSDLQHLIYIIDENGIEKPLSEIIKIEQQLKQEELQKTLQEQANTTNKYTQIEISDPEDDMFEDN